MLRNYLNSDREINPSSDRAKVPPVAGIPGTNTDRDRFSALDSGEFAIDKNILSDTPDCISSNNTTESRPDYRRFQNYTTNPSRVGDREFRQCENSGKIAIFTDGSGGAATGGAIGYAAVIDSPGGWVELGGSEQGSTNQRAELLGLITALEWLSQRSQVGEIYTDSKYAVRGFNEWLAGWQRRGWINSEGNAVANRDLWERVAALKKTARATVTHLRGHGDTKKSARSENYRRFGDRAAALIAGNVRADRAAERFRLAAAVVASPSGPDWAIPADLLAANSVLVADNPDTHETSLTAILDRKTSRSWVPREHREAIAFVGESGKFFQLRYTVNPPIGDDGKVQRYDARKNSGNLYFCPTIPAEYRAMIADTWSIALPQDGSAWDWVKSAAECPVFDAEGPAKALTLVSLGYPAVSGFGAFGGVETSEYRRFKRPIGKRKSGKSGGYTVEKMPIQARLPKGLADLAQVPRRIVLVPDMDANPKTRRKVANAWLRRAALLEKRGCTVRIAYWDKSLGKGIDDVLNSHGADTVRRILDNPLTPQQYRLKIELSFELAQANAVIDSRNMQDDAPELPKTGIVFTDAAVGTGKTKLAARETAGRTLLAPYPLRSLAKAASGPLNADYRNEGTLNKKQGAYYSDDALSDRLTIVYDSLKNLDLVNQFGGELEDLLLDELTHGLRHMLLGATCKRDRLAIVEKVVEAVRVSKRVLALDADLTRTELDMLRELRPGDAEYYLKNIRKPDPWAITWIELVGQRNSAKAIEAIAQQLPSTGFIHWACDSAKTSEKIAAYLEDSGEKCAVINSQRRGNNDPLAELAIAGQFDALEALGVRFVITSPSVIQGLSWEETGRFTGVAGTFTGCSITPRQMRQSLARVREAVPRYIWAEEFRRLPDRWGNDTNPDKIKARILETSGFNQVAINRALSELSEARSIAVDWAARLIAADNLWRATPADGLRILLEEHGHKITPIVTDCDGTSYQATADEWEDSRIIHMLEAEIINDSEAKSLRLKSEFDSLTESERLSLERFDICSFYGIAPEALTAELIEQDDYGSYRRKVRAFEQLYAADGESLARARAEHTLTLSDVDADRSLAALKVREAIGLKEVIELFREGGIDKTHPQLVEFADRCWENRKLIKTALNYTVSRSEAKQNSPIKLAAELIGQIGLSLTASRSRRDGRVTWIYRLADWDGLDVICQTRYQERVSAEKGGDPYPSGIVFPDPYGSPPKSPESIPVREFEEITFNPHDRSVKPGPGYEWDEWEGWVTIGGYAAKKTAQNHQTPTP